MLLRTALVSWTYPLESGIFHDKLKIARVIPLFKAGEAANIKQMFHAFMFNIRNYSPEVINIQRREVYLNIILPRLINFDIKHKKKAWNFVLLGHQQQTRSGKIKANKTVNFGHNTSFLCKNWTTTYLTTTPSKSFYFTFVDIFFLKSLTYEKINRIRIFLTWNWQLIRDWREIKQETLFTFMTLQ